MTKRTGTKTFFVSRSGKIHTPNCSWKNPNCSPVELTAEQLDRLDWSESCGRCKWDYPAIAKVVWADD